MRCSKFEDRLEEAWRDGGCELQRVVVSSGEGIAGEEEEAGEGKLEVNR